jgi:hypothetical protein
MVACPFLPPTHITGESDSLRGGRGHGYDFLTNLIVFSLSHTEEIVICRRGRTITKLKRPNASRKPRKHTSPKSNETLPS